MVGSAECQVSNTVAAVVLQNQVGNRAGLQMEVTLGGGRLIVSTTHTTNRGYNSRHRINYSIRWF